MGRAKVEEALKMSDQKQDIDIVSQLLLAHEQKRLTQNSTTLFSRAADELQRLRAEVERNMVMLSAYHEERQLLREIVPDSCGDNNLSLYDCVRKELERLRKALLCPRCKGRGFYLRDDGSDQGEQMDCPDCEAAQIRKEAQKHG
jgi:hypothetical protein